jgi:hypothetical protein
MSLVPAMRSLNKTFVTLVVVATIAGITAVIYAIAWVTADTTDDKRAVHGANDLKPTKSSIPIDDSGISGDDIFASIQ